MILLPFSLELESILTKYGSLSELTCQIDQIESDQAAQLNLKQTLAFKITFLGKLLGFVTKFNSTIGKFEAIFFTQKEPIYYNGSSQV